MEFEGRIGQPSTFKALLESEQIRPEDVVATFMNYVESGASVSAPAIITALNRSGARIMHLGMIGEMVGMGMRRQEEGKHPADAEEFAMVGRYITTVVNEMHGRDIDKKDL